MKKEITIKSILFSLISFAIVAIIIISTMFYTLCNTDVSIRDDMVKYSKKSGDGKIIIEAKALTDIEDLEFQVKITSSDGRSDYKNFSVEKLSKDDTKQFEMKLWSYEDTDISNIKYEVEFDTTNGKTKAINLIKD